MLVTGLFRRLRTLVIKNLILILPLIAHNNFKPNILKGTWREEAVAAESKLLKVPNDIHPAFAAVMAVNPCTAYRLLRDFVTLKPGDVIIQNGANSMVGIAVIQMAREMGVKTINVIRSDR